MCFGPLNNFIWKSLFKTPFFLTGFLLLITIPPVFAQWEPDRRLTNDTCASYVAPQSLAAGPAGMLNLVWRDDRDGNTNIYHKRSSDSGLTWSRDVALVNDPSGQLWPAIVTSGSQVHLAWKDWRTGLPQIYYKRSTDAGITWSTDAQLTNNTINDMNTMYPALSVSGNTVHVAWDDLRDGNYEIYTLRSTDNGVTWGPETRLTNDPAMSGFIAAALSASGPLVHVIWVDYRDGNPEIYYKGSRDAGATWGSDTRLSNSPSASSYASSVFSSGSRVHVLWDDNRDGNFEIYHRRSTDGGATWGPEARLTYTAGSSNHGNGFAFGAQVQVVWKEDSVGIYCKRSSDSGATWTQDTCLTNGAKWPDNPSLSVMDTQVHLVWNDNRDFRPGRPEVYYKRNPSGNPTGMEVAGEGRAQEREGGLKATPNPFTSFATVPGHASERFALYDISGRKVGVYKGDRIGAGLSAGVYYLKPESGDARLFRIVKLR